MPTVTIYAASRDHVEPLGALIPGLQGTVAVLLSTPDWELRPETISVRILAIDAGSMIAPIELELIGAAFPQRIERQDEICLAVRDWLRSVSPELPEARVWLLLCELGHSW
jgi:hypothetical protein